MLSATKGPKHGALDPRGPYRDTMDVSVAAYEERTRATLSSAFGDLVAASNSTWLTELEDRLLVVESRLRMDCRAPGCPRCLIEALNEFDNALKMFLFYIVFSLVLAPSRTL